MRKLVVALVAGLVGWAIGPLAAEGLAITLDALHHDTHDPLYRYPFGAARTGEEVRLRIRAQAGELEGAAISYRDEIAGVRLRLEMERIGASPDGSYEYWEAAVRSDAPTILWYHFVVKADGETVYYGDPGHDGGPGRAGRATPADFQLTVFDRDFRTPDWMKNAITYQIFPDRFHDGDGANNRVKEDFGFRGDWPYEFREWGQLPDNPRERGVNPAYDGDGIWNNDFFGGDLAGIIAKLDYLHELGVGAIYLNPIFEAASNHKYDTADYRQIDRAFGTNEEFRELAAQARRRGIHLILDGVFNHVGDDSRYFDRFGKWPDVGAYEFWAAVYRRMASDGLTEAEARDRVRAEFAARGQTDFTFTDWFDVRNRRVDVGGTGVYGGERYDYDAWWGIESLPAVRAPGGSELNLASFADYIVRNEDSIARRWVHYGSSGWRLDVSPEVAHDFWTAFRDHVKQGPFPHGEPIMIAENWHDATRDLLGETFDSTMNYRFRDALIAFLLGGDAVTLDRALAEIQEDYPREAFYALMNLLGSHDTPRIKKLLGDVEPGIFADRERAAGKTAAEIAAQNELAAARLKLAAILQLGYPGSPTVYYGDEVGLTGHGDPDSRRTFPWDRVGADNDLLNHYRTVAAIRNENQVLRTGDLVTLHAAGGTYVVGRVLLGQRDALGREAYVVNYHTGETLRIADHNALAIVAASTGGEENLRLAMTGFVRDGALFRDLLNGGREYVVQDGAITLDIPPLGGAILIARHGGQDLLPPSPPGGLAAQEGDRRVELWWEPVADAVSYRVYRTPIIGGHYERIAARLTEPSFTDLEVENLRRYFYAVTAVDAAGNESAMSDHAAAVPSIPVGRTTIRPFGLLGGAHTIGVESEIEHLVVEVYASGVTEGPGRGEAILAQFGFGQDPDPATWTWVPARYLGDRDGADDYAGSFIPDRRGEWFVAIRFSTNLGLSWRLATYEDGSVPSFAVVPSADLTPPPVPSLAEPRLLHRLEAPSSVNLAWSLPALADVHHLSVLRQQDGGTWERLATLPAAAVSYTDDRVVHGREYRYQVVAADRAFNRSESEVMGVIPRPLPLERKSPTVATLAEVKPVIDGAVGEREWVEAVSFVGDGLLERFFIGFDTHHLYLRADTTTAPTGWIGAEYRLVLYIGFYTGAEPGTPINGRARFSGTDLGFPLTQLVQARFEHIRPDGRGNVFRFVADGMGGWTFENQIRLLRQRLIGVGDTIEAQIPFEELGLDRTAELRIWTRLAVEREGELLGAAPAQPVIARIPALVGGELVAQFSDPRGDDHGPGTFVYPTSRVFDVDGIFDLLSYTILDQGANWLLAFEFAALPNPWGGPLGFSHPIVNLYLDVQPGGLTEAHPDGDAMQVRFHPDHPWDFFLKVAGWPDYGRHLFTADGETHLVDVSADPARRLVLVRIPKDVVPEIRGAHYLMIGSQDGFGPDHIRPVARTAGEWVGGGSPAPTVAPLVYDYLAPDGYTQEGILSGFDALARTFAVLVPVRVEGQRR
jgi:glycosidase/fibronectin type 3 domain-containing protein